MRDALHQYVIYRHPLDFPNHFVVREWLIDRDGFRPAPIACLCSTLEEARDSVPGAPWRRDRYPEDDPCIVETWT